MNWFKQTLANVAGTQEPEYGPSAIRPVTTQTPTTPYTELTKEDLKWVGMQSTCVETQTFYFITDENVTALAQVIYSNVGGISTTCQFNSKIFDHHGALKHQFCSDPLKNYGFSGSQTGFFADGVDLSLSEDGMSYTIKAATNDECQVNIKVTRTAPGFQVGKDGTTLYGADLDNPWGSMRHAFWARCQAEGTMTTKEKTYNMSGRATLSYALQGMKPHHAAATWNFVLFHTPTYSALTMEFTTPPSYGKTSVIVGGIVTDGEILCAGSDNTVKHLAVKEDAENDWPEPKAVLLEWSGKDKEGQPVTGQIMGNLPERGDRVDVLSHVPGFVKTIVGGVVGTKPYIYQYYGKDILTLKVKRGDVETSEQGSLFSEATFIS